MQKKEKCSSMPKIFYGWRVAFAGALMMTIGAGLCRSGFTVWLLPLERGFNISRTLSSLVFSFAQMEGGLLGPLTGVCIDRWGSRKIMILFVFVTALGFVLLPLANNYVVFLIIYVGVLSLGFHAGFQQSVMATVNRWFMRRRATAFSIISVGVSLGGAVVTPLVAISINYWGWQTTARVSALVIFCIALPLAFRMKDSPEEIGLLPDGDQSIETEGSQFSGKSVSSKSQDFTARQAFQSRTFWLIALGICIRIAIRGGVFIHIVPLMIWKGLDEAHGALLVGIISISAILSQLLMGWLGDLWSREKLTALGMLMGCGSLLLLLFGPGRLWVMVIFGIIFSIVDSAAPVTWAIVGDYFGRRAFATLRGTISLVVSFGAVITPVLAGGIFDATGSYYWAILPFSALYIVTAGIFFFIRKPKLVE